MLELIAGPTLVRFDYFGLLRLRPVFARRHIADLTSHLRLEAALKASSENAADELACDVTVAMYGETGSGKTTLMRALKDQRGVSRDSGSSKQAKCRVTQQLEIDRLASLLSCGFR